MCDICHSHVCVPSCPNYRGFLPNFPPVRGHCIFCDTAIREDERYLERGEELICAACTAELELSDILELSGLESAAELLLLCANFQKSF